MQRIFHDAIRSVINKRSFSSLQAKPRPPHGHDDSPVYTAAITLFKAFFAICRLQKGPQDLPTSRDLLLVSLVAYTLCSIGVGLLSMTPDAAVVSGLTDTALMILLTMAVLRLRGFTNRMTQTVTAFAGTGTVLSLIAMPILLAAHAARTSHAGSGLPGLLTLFIFIWNLMINAHILRHALSTRLVVGFALAVLYLLVLIGVLDLLSAEIAAP